MKQIKLPLSRIVSGLSSKPGALVLEQEPDEAFTPSMYLVIPDQEVEVEIDEDTGRNLESKVRASMLLTQERLSEGT